MKKTLGYLIVIIISIFSIGVICWDIYIAGWFFILSLIFIICIILLFIYGLSLIDEKKIEKELGISVEVINVSSIKPLDISVISESLNKTKIGVSVEDHQVAGGLGSAILEKISEHVFIPFKIIAINDSFGESGTCEELYEKYGISESKIREKIIQFFKRNK